MIILGHMWLMEHNPGIDWHTGNISMTRCLASCRLKTAEEEDWLNCKLVDKTWKQLKAHIHCQLHVEEVSESHSAHNQAEPPPGFTCANPDGLDKDDQLFIQFIGAQAEEIGATQTISQKLVEASRGALSKCFEDIVPQPYQEF